MLTETKILFYFQKIHNVDVSERNYCLDCLFKIDYVLTLLYNFRLQTQFCDKETVSLFNKFFYSKNACFLILIIILSHNSHICFYSNLKCNTSFLEYNFKFEMAQFLMFLIVDSPILIIKSSDFKYSKF